MQKGREAQLVRTDQKLLLHRAGAFPEHVAPRKITGNQPGGGSTSAGGGDGADQQSTRPGRQLHL